MSPGFLLAGRRSCLALCLLALPAMSMQPQRQPTVAGPQSPQLLFKELFNAVQSSQLFADGKTFADAVPLRAPPEILARFRASKPRTNAALLRFVEANFSLPAPSGVTAPATEPVSITRHIDGLWDQLTRSTPSAPRYGSLLALPASYVVPGGRFREMYYWDSYFTMLGLVESGRHDLAENMVRDFAHLIDTYGHVPNGTRSYYLSLLRHGGPALGRRSGQRLCALPAAVASRVRLLDAGRGRADARHGPPARRQPSRWRDPQPLLG
jgi:alpha,alpha-trehalase